MDATTFLKTFQCLYDSPKISDVTIVLPIWYSVDESVKILAHKTILAAGSHVFREFFENNPPEENDCTDSTGSTDSIDSDVKGSAYKVDIGDVCYLDEPEDYVPVLRYLYGLPLCAEGEHLSALALRRMCDASPGFGIPTLHQHALRKLEDLLSGLLQVQGVKRVDGQPLPSGYQDSNIGPFLFELESLLIADEEDSFDDDTYSRAMEVAVKVCCEHLEILRQFSEFHDHCPSKLYRNMLFYQRAQGCKLAVGSTDNVWRWQEMAVCKRSD